MPSRDNRHFPLRRAVLGGALLGLFSPTTFLFAAEPVVGDAALFAAFDLSAPGLQAVKAAVGAQDWTTAKAALCAYLRKRPNTPLTTTQDKAEPSEPFNGDVANLVVQGLVPRGPNTPSPIGKIDWHFDGSNPPTKPAYVASLRTTLNRMQFWNVLGEAYQKTSDEKYAKTWVSQMRKWVTEQPRPTQAPNRELGKSSWLTIDAGLRMSGSWPRAYQNFLHSPSFTNDDLIVFVKSCYEHGQYLRQFASFSNWLTMEMNGLYSLGCWFPEFKAAKDWRSFAAQKLYDDQKIQFLPDGAQEEGTPGYHNIAVSQILGLYDRAELAGRTNELPPDYRASLERAYDYELFLMAPDRTQPKLNDSGAGDTIGPLRRASRMFPQRKDFLWVATGGKQGAPPTKTSHAFNNVGYFALRSGWETDANYLVFDVGPLGYAHIHQDKLNVVLWAYGRPVLFDSGGGAYDDSIWRKWGVDTFSHNTVLVDGKPQRRQTKNKEANISRVPLTDTRWTTTATFDFAGGMYQDGYGEVEDKIAVHVRRVLFLKPDIFVVADTLTPRDAAEHTYEARWHLLSTQTVTDKTTKAVTTKDANISNLSVVPMLAENLDVRAVSAQMTPELLGWEVRKEKDPPNLPATSVLHVRKGKGVQQFLTLLQPLKPGASSSVTSVRTVGANAVEIVFADGRTVRVDASADPSGAITVQEKNAADKVLREATGK